MIKKKTKEAAGNSNNKVERRRKRKSERKNPPEIDQGSRSKFVRFVNVGRCVCVCVYRFRQSRTERSGWWTRAGRKKKRKLNIDVELISGSNMTLNVNSIKNYSADFQWNSTVRPSFRRSTFGGRSQPERKKTLIISREGKHKKRRNVLSWW